MRSAVIYFFMALAFYALATPFATQIDIPSLYQGRDILRAIDLYSGKSLLWHGPELSGGGFLPGPFYYVLIGLPFEIFSSIDSIFYFEFVLAAFALVILVQFLKNNFSELAGIIYYFYFLGSLFFLNNLFDFWNPSYTFLFFAASFVLLYDYQVRWRLILGALLLGFSLQIHFFNFVLVAGFLTYLLISEDSKKNKLMSLALFLFFILLPQLPFLLTFRKGTDLPGVLTFFNHFKSHISNPFELFYYFLRELYFLPALALVLFHFRKITSSGKNRFLLITLFFSSFMLLWLMRGLYLNRYLIPFFLLLGLALAPVAASLLQNKRWAWGLTGLLMLSFTQRIIFLNYNWESLDIKAFFSIASLILLFFVSRFQNQFNRRTFYVLFSFSIIHFLLLTMQLDESNFQRDAFSGGLSVEEGELIATSIVSTTGWDYAYFRKHSFVQGLDREKDLSLLYRLAQNRHQGPAQFDGLIMRRIQSPVLPQLLTNAFAKNVISCAKEIKTANFELCFYSFAVGETKRTWNNIGNSYQPSELSENPAAGFIRLNDCGSGEISCNVDFRFKMLAPKILQIEITGNPLAAIDPAIHPDWVLGLQRPSLSINCGKKVSNVLIAENLGYEPNRKSFLVPFSDVYEIDCAKPESIALNFKNYESYFNNYIRIEKAQVPGLVSYGPF